LGTLGPRPRKKRPGRSLSWGNQLLIALQTQGEATYVCGFRAWQQLGYAPRKGSKALRILAPRTVKTTEVDHATGDEQEARRLYFRAVAVFNRASVDPIPGADATSLEAPMTASIDHLHTAKPDLVGDDQALARVTPVAHAHANSLGRYELNRQPPPPGQLRPLRKIDDAAPRTPTSPLGGGGDKH